MRKSSYGAGRGYQPPLRPPRNPSRLRRFSLSAPMEVRLDERIEVSVQDCLHVPCLVPGALVLDQLVGRQRIGADLAPERDVALLAGQRLHLLAALLALTLCEPRGEDLHR